MRVLQSWAGGRVAAAMVLVPGFAWLAFVPDLAAEPPEDGGRTHAPRRSAAGVAVDAGATPADEDPGLEHSDAAAAIPQKYTLDYPAAERFCPPVRFTFEEAGRTVSRIGRRTFRHPPNGNFGFQQKVQGKVLVHVGADLALLRVGEPVFAAADGVVRLSMGPVPPEKRKPKPATQAAGEPAKPAKGGGIVAPWGNLIAIEHRLPDGDFVTTIYGHLDTERLVQVGDLVRAGQQIGEIGRKHPFINGGYQPHLHFGVKEGRLAEIGRGLLPLNFGAGHVIARIAAVTEDELELDPAQPLPAAAGDFRLSIAGFEQTLRRKGERYVVPARILWTIPTTPEFPLVGHTSSADGFLDPIAFLRRQQADSRPAPFLFSSARDK